MFEKCVTEGCSECFACSGGGMLFLASPTQKLRKGEVPTVEFFWLCNKCARSKRLKTMERLPVSVSPMRRQRRSSEQ